MKLTLIAATLVLSLGAIEACATETSGPGAKSGTIVAPEQGPGEGNAASSNAQNAAIVSGAGGRGTAGANNIGAAGATRSQTESTRGAAAAPPVGPKTGSEHHGVLPRDVPPHPSNTGDPPPPPDQRR